jgi:hypothetical protein
MGRICGHLEMIPSWARAYRSAAATLHGENGTG